MAAFWFDAEAPRDRNYTTGYPAPWTVPPSSGKHKQTFIILHGRGDEGQNFGTGLLRTRLPNFGRLQNTFPNAEFVFPTASERKVGAFGGVRFKQWFDIKSLVDPDKNVDVQFEGLRESTAVIKGHVRKAIEQVGAENVVLWGLSQGGAMMLTTLLTWDGEPFAAAVGMCTWLPLRSQMLAASVDPAKPASNDTASSAVESTNPDPERLDRAIACLQKVIEGAALPENGQAACKRIPIFLGHGTQDETVAINLGRRANEFLELMDLEVQWKEYEGLHHWYSPEMLGDLVDFLVGRCGIVP